MLSRVETLGRQLVVSERPEQLGYDDVGKLVFLGLPLPHVAGYDFNLVLPLFLLQVEQSYDRVRVLLDREQFDSPAGGIGGSEGSFHDGAPACKC